ncbi:MAG: T9SS type A sorting domain-containing protein [Burkholderiales bacterium]|nr:T9SS type A sorting domain-containing protein [Flavobacterium sp.]
MKTTKNYIVVFLTLLLSSLSALAQYNGGSASGYSAEELNTTSCSIPAHFYVYFGGNNDGTTVDELSNTACGIPPSFFAYQGGDNDGATVDELGATICGIPPSFYAYLGGENDGAATDEFLLGLCPFPPSFYAYFGGSGDGFIMDVTAPVCPITPPIASFIASATNACLGQSVTFTDTSTNLPSNWSWTFAGGTPATSALQNPIIQYSSAGTYAVTLAATNYNGTDTITLAGYITVTAYPTVLTVSPASRCDSGTLTLSATANAGTLNWYAAVTGGAVLATGTAFTTPSLSTTTTYYVGATNGNCNSTRTAVIATVNTTPTLLTTTPNSRCGTGTLTLSATASAGNTIWYATPTGGTALATSNSYTTPAIAVTTTYYVEATTSSCTSPRNAVVATVNVFPSVLTTTPGSRCDTGTVTLGAAGNAGTLNWYANASGGSILGSGTSFTTPTISATTTYYVEAATATCSSPRIAVLATASVSPTITSTTPAARCDAGSLTLLAASSAGSAVWYAVATGGTALASANSFTTPNIAATTVYYVEAVNGSCVSNRIAVTATINPSPTITATTAATICGGDAFTITATASAGTLAWYNLPSGGLLQGSGNTFSLSNWNTTTTFYVQATDGSCQSARIPVVVTVNERLFNTVTAPASHCGTGTLILGVTYTVGTIQWFANATGGLALATGSTYTTPTLSATTTYYAEAVNNGCVSATRIPILATVDDIPLITSTTPNSRCGTGNVTLQATANVGTLGWFASATGGSALAFGSSFTTGVQTVSVTYYVEVSNGTCISPRTAVNATIYTAVMVLSTAGASRCDSGTLTLSASIDNTGTLQWYANASGGAVLATGPNFTTPILNATTTFYVEATNGDCISPRVAVTASIVPTAAPGGFNNQTFCAGETVGLIAADGTNLVWYDTLTGGNVISNATVLVSGNTYYGSQTVGSCESPSRLAVTLTLGNCLATDAFVLNQLQWYPNPVTDILTIVHSEPMTNITVIDMLGRILYAAKSHSLEEHLDLSRFPTGTYLVQVHLDRGLQTFKVIKK